MTKHTSQMYKFEERALLPAMQKYGECLTSLDQEGLNNLMTAYKTTKDALGSWEPSCNSESQIGRDRRFRHVLTVVKRVSEVNSLELPEWVDGNKKETARKEPSPYNYIIK